MDKKKNILITSAGKRVELLFEFQRAVSSIGGKVYTADLNPKMSPACQLSDGALTVPRVTKDEYIDALLEICKSYDIQIVVPTIDTELQMLAKNKCRFEENDIDVMVSDIDFINVCRDKRLTMSLFEQLDIRNPAMRDKYAPVFPMFAKPYDGSLSTNIHVLKCAADITADIMNDPKLLFMEYIDRGKYKEFTVDMYYGADNYVKCIVPRERIEIRSGEVNKGATRKNSLVGYLKERMDYMPGVRGCICIQLFYRLEDNDVVGIEINPRYGGGYPLSYYADANFPSLMVQEYILGKPIEYSDTWLDNTIMLRYDAQVIVHE